MGKTIVFVNQKGGVGKTTSCINIGAYIALSGKKVLLVDFDSQGNMSSGIGVSKDKPTIYELIAGHVTPEQAVKHSSVKGLDAISASIDLSGAAIELVEQQNREFFLKNALCTGQSKRKSLYYRIYCRFNADFYLYRKACNSAYFSRFFERINPAYYLGHNSYCQQEKEHRR